MLTLRRDQIEAMHQGRRRRLMREALHADQKARPQAWQKRSPHETQALFKALYEAMEKLSPFECLTDEELAEQCRLFLGRQVGA